MKLKNMFENTKNGWWLRKSVQSDLDEKVPAEGQKHAFSKTH